MTGWSGLSVGYVPHGPAMDRPFDRRRFPRFARSRGLALDVVDRWSSHDCYILSPSADVTRWVDAPPNVRIVVDLPDAYLAEDFSIRRAVRGVAKWVGGESARPVASYRRALERLLQRADAVVCSTGDQAEAVSAFNDNVHPILDLHGEFPVVEPSGPRSDRLELVWEGLTATLPAVSAILPALRSMADRRSVCLHLVTDLEAPRYMNRFVVRRTADLVADWGVPIELHQWSVDCLVEVAGSADLAVVPVDLNAPFAAGKPENRMRIFWRLGLPVVASSSPAHRRAMTVAGLGDRWLCDGLDDWRTCFESVGKEPARLSEAARAGQQAAVGPYADSALEEKWLTVLRSIGLGPV